MSHPRVAAALSCALCLALCVSCTATSPHSDAGPSESATSESSEGHPTEGTLDIEGDSAYVLGTDLFDAPDLDAPARSGSVAEPVFGTPIVRLTDIDVDRYEGPGIQNEYAKADPENADGTRVFLRATGGAWYLYDRSSGELEPVSDIFAECDQEPEPRWDAEDPDVFYFVCGAELRVRDLGTGTTETVHDFAADIPGTEVVRSRFEGDASLDRRYWAFLAEDDDGEPRALVVYDRQADSVVGTKRDLADEVDWVGVDHSGEHVLVGYERLPSMEVFSRDLAESRRLPEGSNAHGDAAQTADGRNVWVFQNTATDMIEMADLGTGEVTPLLPIPFETNPDIGLHVSGNCAETPGWVLVSTYGARTPPEGAEHSWMDTQLFMLELARDPVVWRLCHTRCFTAETADEDPMYFAEAFAAVNTSGTRVYYGSNWGDIEPDYTDAYMLALPDEWSRVIAE